MFKPHKYFLLALLCAVHFMTQAQLNLLVTTSGGGINGNGSLFKYNADANTAKADSVFWKTVQGRYPLNTLTDGENGLLYGATQYGGEYGNGIIYSVDTSTFDYQVIVNFDNSFNLGGSPNGGLILASDGMLYGTTQQGGSSGKGILFSYDIGTSTFTKLHDFVQATGSSPYCGVIQASNNKLYGSTLTGGSGPSNGDGTIYEYDISTSTYTMLADFSENSAFWPYSALVQADDSKLYGVVSKNGEGYVYSYDISIDTLILEDFFTSDIAQNPKGALIQASDGNLYGLSFLGGSTGDGTIYGFNMTTKSVFNVMDFTGNSTGENGTGVLFEGAGNRLYGVTDNGGGNFWGALFYYDLDDSNYNIVYDFDDVTGETPNSGVICLNGKFYGVTREGGGGQDGVVYSFDTTTTEYQVMVQMGATNGKSPNSEPVLYSGNLYYGMARGGANGHGVIYAYDVSTGDYGVVYDFKGIDGDNPFGKLFLASDGLFYGLTYQGGTNDVGVIFSFDPTDSTFTKLQDLNMSVGALGANEFIELSDGKLYSTTVSGGANGVGAIISYDPVGDVLSTVYSFVDDGSGKTPRAGLLEATNGLLYGNTSKGGVNDRGTIFSYALSGGTYTKLHDFENDMGQVPYTAMIELANGKLYGTAGGLNFFDLEAGVLFSFDINTSTYAVVHDFSTTGSVSVSGRLLLASDGSFYGLAGNKIFSMDTTTWTYSNLYSLTTGIGSGAAEVGLIEVSCETPTSMSFVNATANPCQGQSGVAYSVDGDTWNTYSWNYGGSDVSINEFNESATLDFGASATSGDIAVDAENKCGTLVDAATYSVTIGVCTGVEDDVISEVHLYPNPSNGKVTIDSDIKGDLSIRSISGIEVYTSKIEVGEVQEVSSLRAGLYIVEVQNDQEKHTVKLIVQ